MSQETPHVLILGAGVHGAALARNLAGQGISVHVVDRFDLASGATSKSSRLIHGGLRYLEYGDFRLVRESLQARRHNLLDYPWLVRELRLYIPTRRRWSGLARSMAGFFGLSRTGWTRRWLPRRTERGFWPLRVALGMYDWLGGGLPRSSALPVGAPGTPRVNASRYRWLCAYSDAQMLFPERLVIALLAAARRLAQQRHVHFRVTTYATVRHHSGQWLLHDERTGETQELAPPDCVINATGAWGDAALQGLDVAQPLLFGGTKGTHFVTWNESLRAALNNAAVYAEAEDGRLVFVLPFGDGVLVGTTDETFAASPEQAAATDEELDYLLQLVNGVMNCRLTRADIALHYSGVRPLPRAAADSNAAVTRDHALVEHRCGGCPVITLVGGKLTTWREFAAEVTDRVLKSLPSRAAVTDVPSVTISPAESRPDLPAIARRFGCSEECVASLWTLYGPRVADILADCQGDDEAPIHGTCWTSGLIRWMIDQEWVRTLSDLVERRTMLVFSRRLERRTLEELADCLIASGVLDESARSQEIDATRERLRTFYGREVISPTSG